MHSSRPFRCGLAKRTRPAALGRASSSFMFDSGLSPLAEDLSEPRLQIGRSLGSCVASSARRGAGPFAHAWRAIGFRWSYIVRSSKGRHSRMPSWSSSEDSQFPGTTRLSPIAARYHTMEDRGRNATRVRPLGPCAKQTCLIETSTAIHPRPRPRWCAVARPSSKRVKHADRLHTAKTRGAS